jgi:NodT family efflux transporter outer membrane factor (OMF) lipoprotein
VNRIPGVRPGIAVAWSALLAACAVGPDFQRPPPPSTGVYSETPLPEGTASAPVGGGQAQNFQAGREISRQWWTLFRNEPLNRLVDDALRDSPTVSAASAALRQAQEVLNAERGSLTLPAVNAQASVARDRGNGASLGLPSGGHAFDLYNASVGVSYTFDLFGGVRRQLEGAQAQVDYESYQLRAAQLALTTNLVTTAIREASLRAQTAAVRDIEKLQQTQLDVVERRFNLGAVSRSDVLSERTTLAQTRASLPPLERELAQTRHQLAVYAGRPPSELGPARFELDELELPVELPLTVPSELVRQRPDVLAAESLLHAAAAQVGVATANLYPQLTLGGSYGFQSLKASDLFRSDSIVWGLSAGIVEPLFRGGALQAQRRAAIAGFDVAAASYRQTVLVALQNVADTLRALELDALTLKAQSDALVQAQQALEMAERQFAIGAISYLSLLNAQQQYQQARIAVVQARAARYADTAALFQALGGGWWNQEPSPGAQAPARG